MNLHINFVAEFHFEVRDSPIYGGDGSIGYVKTKLEPIDITVFQESSDKRLSAQIKYCADFLKVSTENIKLISKEEYERETEEDSKENEYDEDFPEDELH